MHTCEQILLVEDDEDDQHSFLEAIRKIDPKIQVLCRNNGRLAMDYLEQCPVLPQIIFLDINMPMVNGLECLAMIRKNSRFQYIPVFILSTSGNPVSVTVAQRLGADGYLTKPYEREIFLPHLMQVVQSENKRIGKEGPNAFLRLLTHHI